MAPHAETSTQGEAHNDKDNAAAGPIRSMLNDPNYLKPPKSWFMGAEAFQRRMPHHDGMKELWETRWRIPVRFVVLVRPVETNRLPPVHPVRLPLPRRRLRRL
jgi:hypothetical protein